MLIGGLAGRLVGAVARDYCGYTGLAVSGVYAMAGGLDSLDNLPLPRPSPAVPKPLGPRP